METFLPAPVFSKPLGTGTIIQHLMPSLRQLKYSQSADGNIWPASSHRSHHKNEEMRKHTRNIAVCHTGINHLSPKRPASTAENEPRRTTGLLLWSVTPCCFFLKTSSRKQEVNPRQSKTCEVTQLPIAIIKHSSRNWPAQQVSQASLARYLSFQQRCCSFFQKCCLLKQTGQIVVEMLRKCQSAKCQKDFY